MSEKPTKEELIQNLRDSIELRKVQLELQELNTAMAVSRANELKAMAFMAQMREPEEEPVSHTVTQEDIDNNPELAEAGVTVGQEILIPNPEPAKSRNLKKVK